MYRILFVLFVVFRSFELCSQEVVSWTFSYDREKEIFNATAKVDEGWHLYSQTVDPFAGPIPTQFTFENEENLKFKGKVKEPKPHKAYDPNFDSNVAYFENEVTFKQRIGVKDGRKASIKGVVTYMVCNDTMCLPPEDEHFIISIN